MQEIEMPDGSVLEFPDGMDDAAIKSAISTYKPEPMSMGTMFSQAGSNLVPSAKQAASDLVQPFLHPIDTFNSVKNLGKGVVQKVLPGEQPEEKYADAFGKFFMDRYGGIENAKRTFATDPVGFMSDASMFITGGGSAAAKAPGIIGKIGKGAKFVGNAVDPLALVGKAAGTVAAPVLGMTTGAGGDAIRGAIRSGAAGGSQGDAFRANMRGGADIAGSVVEEAEQAVGKMRTTMQSTYLADKANWAKANKAIDWAPINKALDNIGDVRSFRGTSGTGPIQSLDAKASKARLNALKIVNDWQKLDPTEYHTVLGLDALKQKIGAELKNIPYTEPSARKVYGEVYNAIKKEIIRQEPTYGAAMNKYEQASEALEDVTKTLSLNPKASVDTKLRKLQSIMRNNVNANYGARMKSARALEDAGAGTLMSKLSGQSLNSWTPRGIAGLAGAGNVAANLSLGGAASMLDPTVLGSMAMQSPRIVGELTHGIGRFGMPAGHAAYQAGRNPWEE
jgi:hypothetical protein